MAFKNLIRRAAERFGFTITREEGATLRQHLRFAWRRLGVECVLDVGAHVGEYWRLCREIGFRGSIVSFEPAPESFIQLRRTAAADSSWYGFNIALGDSDREETLFLHPMSACNSFSPTTQYMADRYGLDQIPATSATVPVRRLDNFIREIDQRIGIHRRVFLKVDTQSHDLAVLDGAAGCLNRIVGLQVEVSVKKLYRDSLLLPDAIREYNGRGFEVTGFFPVVRDYDGLRVVEFDCVMVSTNDMRDHLNRDRAQG